MSNPPTELTSQAALRARAQARLAGQTHPPSPHANASAALRVLYEFALSPTTAPDALALLHELQVHQVELELQAEELRAARTELESALAHQIQRYDCAPTANFTVDRDARLADLNLTGAQRLGCEREALRGQKLDSFLTPQSVAALHDLLARAAQSNALESCELALMAPKQTPRSVCASARIDPMGEGFLLAFIDMPARGAV